MLRQIALLPLAVALTATSIPAQAAPSFRSLIPTDTVTVRREQLTFVPHIQQSTGRSHAKIGAAVGGVVGVAAGLIIGHGTNMGCKLGDSSCDPESEQVKMMVVTAALLGGVGAGLGYLAGKFWPKGNDSRFGQNSALGPSRK